MTLTWPPAPGAIKYELEWRPSVPLSSSPPGEWAKLGSKGFMSPFPPKQKSGLAPGVAFDFRVRGRDALDWFAWTAPVSHSTLAPGTKRLPPVTLQNAEEGALTVAWAAPEEGTKCKYELQIREASAPQWTTVSEGARPGRHGRVARFSCPARPRP